MPFYEIVYETGRMSVAQYDSDDEAKEAIAAHHARAVKGEAGGPVGAPAERIKDVFVYNQHPDNYNMAQTASKDVLKKELENLVDTFADDNGVVAIDRLAMEVRGLSHPMANNRGTFDSFYRAKESKKLNMSFLEGVK